jgi:hypothetical protein
MRTAIILAALVSGATAFGTLLLRIDDVVDVTCCDVRPGVDNGWVLLFRAFNRLQLKIFRCEAP